MIQDVVQQIDRIHPYPAKFTVDLAAEYIEKYTKPGDVVYDPFVGAGTTLLASSVMGRKSFGTDINHIAILISQFKLLKLSGKELNDLSSFINDFEKNYAKYIEQTELFDYPSINHWFCDNSIRVLSCIKFKIESLHSEGERIFSKLVMSSIINTVSNQESDTRYAAKEKKGLTIPKIAEVFITRFRRIFELYSEFNKITRTDGVAALLDSKRCGEILSNDSVDLLLTSPPYVNTYDYYLYHKHRMNWLGYDVKFSMNAEIGSRREYSSLKHKEEKFNDDLLDIYRACNNVLKAGATIVMVIGDGKVAGHIYDAKDNMVNTCKKLGWKLSDYSYSELDKTSRSFQKSFRTANKKEHILTFTKEK